MKTKGIILAALSAASLQAQLFNLDSFDVGDFSTTPTDSFNQTLDENEVFGGDRRVNLYNSTTGSASVAGGALTYTDTGNTLLTLQYGSFTDADPSRDLNFDASGGLMLRIIVTEMSEPFEAHFSLYDFTVNDQGTSHNYGGNTIAINEPGEHYLRFDDLIWNQPNDMTSIAGMEFIPVSTPQLAGTFEFGSLTISPIPEPSTYAAMFGVGLVGFAVVRRAKRKQS